MARNIQDADPTSKPSSHLTSVVSQHACFRTPAYIEDRMVKRADSDTSCRNGDDDFNRFGDTNSVITVQVRWRRRQSSDFGCFHHTYPAESRCEAAVSQLLVSTGAGRPGTLVSSDSIRRAIVLSAAPQLSRSSTTTPAWQTRRGCSPTANIRHHIAVITKARWFSAIYSH